MTNHQISWQKTVEEMARLCEENAALRERAEKAERQAAKLAEQIDTWEVECPNDMHMWQCKVFTDNAECPKNQAECWLEWAAQP